MPGGISPGHRQECVCHSTPSGFWLTRGIPLHRMPHGPGRNADRKTQRSATHSCADELRRAGAERLFRLCGSLRAYLKGIPTTLGDRQERARQITPCTGLAPDFPISPGKMRPSFYPSAWFRGKYPGRPVCRPQSFAESLLQFRLADRPLTVCGFVEYLTSSQFPDHSLAGFRTILLTR